MQEGDYRFSAGYGALVNFAALEDGQGGNTEALHGRYYFIIKFGSLFTQAAWVRLARHFFSPLSATNPLISPAFAGRNENPDILSRFQFKFAKKGIFRRKRWKRAPV